MQVKIKGEIFEIHDNESTNIPYRLYQKDRKKNFYAHANVQTYDILDFLGNKFETVPKDVLDNPQAIEDELNVVTINSYNYGWTIHPVGNQIPYGGTVGGKTNPLEVKFGLESKSIKDFTLDQKSLRERFSNKDLKFESNSCLYTPEIPNPAIYFDNTDNFMDWYVHLDDPMLKSGITAAEARNHYIYSDEIMNFLGLNEFELVCTEEGKLRLEKKGK